MRMPLLLMSGVALVLGAVARAQSVEPVYLGRLFDDAKGVTLKAAMSKDVLGAGADDTDLGVWIVVSGGLDQPVAVAPGLKFSFVSAGGGKLKHSKACNAAVDTASAKDAIGIRTTGKVDPALEKGKKVEEGIGLHANNFLTLDMDEIRKAGEYPAGQVVRLVVDRAGINDSRADAKWPMGSVRVVALVIKAGGEGKPQVLAGYINGEKVAAAANDQGVWNFTGAIPKELTAGGKYVAFDVEIPPDATHVILACTSGSGGISHDHCVLSGARLEPRP